MRTVILIAFSFFTIARANAQQLQSYIQEAELNSPQIQVFESRYSIAKEKINEANTVPNTEVSVGYFVSRPETRTGAQRAKFSIQQMLPWFGSIKTRENYASSLAEAEFIEITIAKRKLALSVSETYYLLYAIRAKQKVLDINIALLKTYEKMALTATKVGKASAVDVLKLQIRQNELLQQKKVLLQKENGIQVAMNSLLNHEHADPVEVVTALEIPKDETIPDFETLSLNPELIKYDKLYNSVVEAEKLNQKEKAPNFGIGISYIPVEKRPAMDFSDNGKDIFMPMVSLSIPIFNNTYKSRTKQNELRQKKILSQKENRLNVLTSSFAKAISQRNQARIKFDIQGKNLKQARNAKKILINQYETNRIDFNDILDIQELQLKFEINQIEAVQEYYVQAALINYLSLPAGQAGN
jgi:outer membrane protein TolC